MTPRAPLSAPLLPIFLAGCLVACGQKPAQAPEAPDDVKALIQTVSEEGPGVKVASPKGTEAEAPAGAAAVQTHYGTALRHFREGDPRAGLRELEKCLAAEPSFTDGWVLRGQCHEALGEHDEAVTAFLKVAELDPANGDALRSAGQALLAAGNNEKALETFAKAAEVTPTASNQATYARLLATKGDFAAASALYKSVVEKQPQIANVRREYADVLVSEKKPKEAMEQYKAAVAIDPKDERTLYNYAVLLQQEGKGAEAADLYKKTIEVNPKHAEAQLNLGICYVEAGDRKAAAVAFEEYLKLRPDAPDAAKVRDQLAVLEAPATVPAS